MSDLDARPHAIAPEDSAERVSPTALSRPAPQVPPAERARAWLDWYGPGRLSVLFWPLRRLLYVFASSPGRAGWVQADDDAGEGRLIR